MEKTLRNMIDDYLCYGYGLKTFLEQDYNITKSFTLEKLKEIWKQEIEKMGDEY